VVGMVNMKQIFNEEFYQGLEGGILEGFGKLFPDNTRLFVYPELNSEGQLNNLDAVTVPENLRFLYQHLLDNGFIKAIESSDAALFKIYSRDVLKQLSRGLGDWQNALPDGVADEIIDKKLFGFRS